MTGLLWKKEKPLIGFEPMTYALPWRYSTTELKGLIWFYFRTSPYVDKISICTYIIYISICSRLIVASGWFLNKKMDLPSKSRVKWILSRPALMRSSLSKQNSLDWYITYMYTYQFDIKSISRYFIESCDEEILLVPWN